MKFTNDWIVKLFTDTDFATQITAFFRSLTTLLNLAVVASAVYLPYQAILAIVSWFR